MRGTPAIKFEQEELCTEGIADGSISEGLALLANAAKLQGKWLRVFDIRYSTAGHPIKITPDYIMFAPGAIEVLETGPLAGPTKSFEVLAHERFISTYAIIQAEICEPNKK